MKRRDFIVRSAVLALAPGGLATCTRSESAAPEGWDAVRASFALQPGEHNLTAWWFATHQTRGRRSTWVPNQVRFLNLVREFRIAFR